MQGINTKVLAAASTIAVALLITLEGNPGKPYRDVAGILTDCYGNTHNVSPNHIRTEDECKALMKTEVGKLGRMILKDNPDTPVEVLASGISFTYNIGSGGYSMSQYRQKLINGDFMGACYEMKKWVYITNPITKRKEISKGLVNRRAQEVELCLEGV